MSRPIDAYALIEKARFEARGMEEPFRSSFAVTVAWLVEKMPTIEPEITQEDIELYCRRRCLTVITDDLYNEMMMRWPAQPTQSNAPNTLDVISRQAAIDGKISIQRADGVEIYSDEAVPVEYLRALPSAQPYIRGVIDESGRIKFIEQTERKTGKWIQISPAGIYECSECGKNVMTNDIDEYKWCHGCGCKMETEG